MKINLDHPKISGETTVQNAVTEVAAMVGENVKIRRGYALSTSSHGAVLSYLHTCPQPGKPIVDYFNIFEQALLDLGRCMIHLHTWLAINNVLLNWS